MRPQELADLAWAYVEQEEQYQRDFRMHWGKPSPHGVPPPELEADRTALRAAEAAGAIPTIEQILQKYKFLDEQARKKANWVRRNCRFAATDDNILDVDVMRKDIEKLRGIDPRLDKVIASINDYWGTDDMRVGTIWVEDPKDGNLQIRFVSRVKSSVLKKA